ncbi:MAG: hypothetical protein ACI9MC_000651 [Kiritimatiellia bacterium]|jgi:hypothetical protein
MRTLLILCALSACTAEISESQAITEVSFWAGECMGMCIRDLALNADGSVEVVGSNHEGAELLRNSGDLSQAGVQALAVIEADLMGVQLAEQYGCPDCDDGGGTTMTRLSATTNGFESSDYEGGNPPSELQAIDSFSSDVLLALLACEDHTMVDIDEGCLAQ